MELAVIMLFCVVLFACVALGLPVLAGLGAGLVIFSAYALLKRHSVKELLMMIADGIKTAKSVLIAFICIGLLTGAWRACGTIPALISVAAGCCVPNLWVLITFLSCCVVSFLIGTAFGTAATMGVVAMTIGSGIGIDPAVMGGAIISGCYFGDRCSPVSSSALLVSELTETNLGGNIPAMLKTCAVPFVLTCVLYVALGAGIDASTASVASANDIGAGFDLNPVVYLPAAAVIVLSLLKVECKLTLFISAAIAFAVGILLQGISPTESLWILLAGFTATGSQSALLDGGGIVSMINASAIVCIASAYAGIFSATGLLRGIQKRLTSLAQRISPFGTCLLTSVLTSMLSCNQTLAAILTHQICKPVQPDGKNLAIDLANSAIVIAPLVPWSIACTVPTSITGAPTTSILLAAFIYLVPLWNLVVALVRLRRS